MILFFAVLLALIVLYLMQEKLYAKKAYKDLHYRLRISTEEAFEGEDIYLYEEIENAKTLPLPFVKINTDLPEGLYFHFVEKSRGTVRDTRESVIQSMFALRSYQRIRRRWRVTCRKRGVYVLNGGVLVTNDLFGFNPRSVGSKELEDGVSAPVLVVLPRAVSLAEGYVSSQYLSGDVLANHALLTDPLLRAGSREYTDSDPMNRINWVSTAVHGRLMTHIEEHTRQFTFNIVLNMNSRDIEHDATRPSAPQYIEQCITVAASLFDRVSTENTAVKLISNLPPDSFPAENGVAPAGMDEIGKRIAVSRAYCGKQDMIEALRLLAAVPMTISCPIEQMLSYLSDHPFAFASGGNLIFVTSYISERMLLFHEEMKQKGIHIIYYVTSGNQNALSIPADVEMYFALAKNNG